MFSKDEAALFQIANELGFATVTVLSAASTATTGCNGFLCIPGHCEGNDPSRTVSGH
jgi:hypothetical protein